MRPWITLAYCSLLTAVSAVFFVDPIGQGSFSDGMHIVIIPISLYGSYVLAQ